MKGKSLKVFILLLAGSMALSSCVGSFSLFNKLATWNKGATKEKFLNEIIFLVISPAYAFCGVADALVLNTIEFWISARGFLRSPDRKGRFRCHRRPGDQVLIWQNSKQRRVRGTGHP